MGLNRLYLACITWQFARCTKTSANFIHWRWFIATYSAGAFYDYPLWSQTHYFCTQQWGYTIERLILGENASYNDIQNWKYTELVQVFNGKEKYQTSMVETAGQLKMR